MLNDYVTKLEQASEKVQEELLMKMKEGYDARDKKIEELNEHIN